MTTNYYFERVLFVVGEPNAGKSKQLRSMFLDVRLGNNGVIPEKSKLKDMHKLSNERSLYLRLCSPHEMRENIDKKPENEGNNFLDKTEEKIVANTPFFGRRWNFACPLQPNKANDMPDVVATVKAFTAKFNPERTRVVFLSPDRHGTVLQDKHLDHVTKLRAIEPVHSVETCWIDARDKTANGLLLADFFDFT